MRNFLKPAALVVLVLGALIAEAKADVVFTFVEVSATIDGVPTNANAQGEVVLTDTGFASGFVSVSTIGPPDEPTYLLNGVVSMFFEALGGPILGTKIGAEFGILPRVTFGAIVNGPFLILGGDPTEIFSQL